MTRDEIFVGRAHTGLGPSWTAASPTLFGEREHVDSTRLAQDRLQPAVQAGNPEAQARRSTATLIGWFGADKVGEMEEQKGLTSVTKARVLLVGCV